MAGRGRSCGITHEFDPNSGRFCCKAEHWARVGTPIAPIRSDWHDSTMRERIADIVDGAAAEGREIEYVGRAEPNAVIL